MEHVFYVDKQSLAPVQTFDYLCMKINLRGVQIAEQIKKNIDKTRKKWYKAKRSKMLDMEKMPWESKLTFVKTIAIPTLECGLYFTLQKKHYVKKVQTFITKYIRLALGLTTNRNKKKTNLIEQ
jgi:hypothetical protein